MNNDYVQMPQQMNELKNKSRAFFQKRSKLLILLGIALVVAVVLIDQCFFIVNEAEQAVVSRFGVITKIIVDEHSDFHERYKDALKDEITMSGSVKIEKGSGVHVKMPFVDKVDIYPSLMFSYASAGETVNTLEKKQYHVSTYAQWTIADPALFSLKLGTSLNAENQLDNLIHPVIVQAINRLSGDDFISNKAALNAALKRGLDLINQDMVIRGIEIKDIQVHRTILPQANVETTYDRMKADRAKVAQQLRSEGEQQYQMAVSDTDLQASLIKSEAIQTAGQSRAEGDAQALAIVSDVYKTDPQFYAFWRSLQALENSLTENSTLVLS
ncbi:MAG TPA: protease modulator HflC, partial [Clostridiales bacterium]|nr:protease modulator HflC [Clostridiales bacterium]